MCFGGCVLSVFSSPHLQLLLYVVIIANVVVVVVVDGFAYLPIPYGFSFQCHFKIYAKSSMHCLCDVPFHKHSVSKCALSYTIHIMCILCTVNKIRSIVAVVVLLYVVLLFSTFYSMPLASRAFVDLFHLLPTTL